jgi:hypothetical protein
VKSNFNDHFLWPLLGVLANFLSYVINFKQFTDLFKRACFSFILFIPLVMNACREQKHLFSFSVRIIFVRVSNHTTEKSGQLSAYTLTVKYSTFLINWLVLPSMSFNFYNNDFCCCFRLRLKFSCMMELSRYPLDTQTCAMMLSSCKLFSIIVQPSCNLLQSLLLSSGYPNMCHDAFLM